MKSFKRILKPFMFVLFAVIVVTASFMPAIKVYADDPVKIMIDPGHGGTNMGAIHNGITEKWANLQVASAMKKELERYEGVEVYITREVDKSLELYDRAYLAEKYDVDLMVSLHFNMSENHDQQGAEGYVPANYRLKRVGKDFLETEMELLEQYGMPIRGIFTRLNGAGSDYYGVIRESAARKIPTVILEHCYLDQPGEEMFYNTNAALERFGRIDATAIAMTYELKSEELGVDYSGLKKKDMVLPEAVLADDTSAPIVELLCDYDENTKEAFFTVNVTEEECALVQYAVSYDGGQRFEEPEYIGARESFTFFRNVYTPLEGDIVVKVWNAYDLEGKSNAIAFNDLYMPEQEAEEVIEVIEVIEPEEEVTIPLREVCREPWALFVLCGSAFAGAIALVIAFMTRKIGA